MNQKKCPKCEKAIPENFYFHDCGWESEKPSTGERERIENQTVVKALGEIFHGQGSTARTEEMKKIAQTLKEIIRGDD